MKDKPTSKRWFKYAVLTLNRDGQRVLTPAKVKSTSDHLARRTIVEDLLSANVHIVAIYADVEKV